MAHNRHVRLAQEFVDHGDAGHHPPDTRNASAIPLDLPENRRHS
jgi:hypothetical protein